MRTAVTSLLIWCAALVAGLAVRNDYFVSVATAAALLAIWAQSWNVLGGLSGQISLGHSAFIAVAAYVTLILYQTHGVTPLIGLLISLLVVLLLAATIGLATLRLRGPYFSLATLSASAVLLTLIVHFKDVTGGANGLAVSFTHDSPLELEFLDVRAYYVIAITALLGVTVLVRWLRRSRLGFYLLAIRSSETAAAAAGVRIAQARTIAFCLSAVLAGAGGVIYVFYLGFAEPTYLAGLPLSIDIALMAVVGGTDYLAGPIVGAIFLEVLRAVTNAYAGSTGGWDALILGVAVVLVVVIEPRGLIAIVARLRGPLGSAARRLGLARS